VIIERCFGYLKQHFPILQHTVGLSSQKIPKLIICHFILYNIAKYIQDSEPEFGKDFAVTEGDNEDAAAGNIRLREKLGGIN